MRGAAPSTGSGPLCIANDTCVSVRLRVESASVPCSVDVGINGARLSVKVKPLVMLARVCSERVANRWLRELGQDARTALGIFARGEMWSRASISGSLTGRAHAMVTSVHVLRDVALGTSNRTDAHHTQVAVQPGILAQCESISLFTSDSSKSWPRPVHLSHAWPRRPSAGCHRAVGRF